MICCHFWDGRPEACAGTGGANFLRSARGTICVMKLLALLAVLLIEQMRPLRQDNAVHAAFTHGADYLRQQFDAGQYRQGVMAWLAAVIPLTLLVFVAHWMLSSVSAVLAMMFSIGVLYVIVGFRKFSKYFNEINSLMRIDEINGAREQLRLWRNEDCTDLNSSAIARLAIELGLMSSHRNVFGPVAWFMVFGPAGALFYWLAALLHDQWRTHLLPEAGHSDEFTGFAKKAFEIIDWLPARLTAASFAIVGNFQDAVDCWRSQASLWADASQGIILASGAGALGVKLGSALPDVGNEWYRPELGTGDDADADYLSSAVGLIWRALVMWMLLISVVTLAHSTG